MPRAKFIGVIALFVSLILSGLFIYSIYIVSRQDFSIVLNDLIKLNDMTFYSVAVPISLVSFFVIGTGFWIGFTILSIKVVPPMPEIVEKRDLSKIKAVLLCTITLGLAGLLGYGLYIRSFWSLAVPAAVISLIILGAVFWVGIAIITTRSTLPEKNS